MCSPLVSRQPSLRFPHDRPLGPTPTHLAGAELADEQRAPLRVLPPVQAVQLGSHLVQLLVRIVELGKQLRVRPLQGREVWE